MSRLRKQFRARCEKRKGFTSRLNASRGLYSHPEQQIFSYPSGETVHYVTNCVLCRVDGGTLEADQDESLEVGFFHTDRLPSQILPMHPQWITDTVENIDVSIGLLPCMLLCPAFLYAFGQGSPVYGLLSLGVLGLGTIPSVFLYGTVVQSVSARQRQVVHYELGVLFIGLGYVLLAMGLMRFGVMLPLPDVPYYQPIAESEVAT